MNPERFEAFVGDILTQIRLLMKDKNIEYSRSSDDRLANFKRRANTLGLDPLTVLHVDLEKHQDAITSFIQRRRNHTSVPINDPITRRAHDVIVYHILLLALIEDLEIKETRTKTGQLEEIFISNYSNKPDLPEL